ncbi:MAG: ABC transporter substrate-binding protein [Dehalococcoidia bacterium]|jgi:peptide/nickel transport system substrate-binding protein|nr:ABC transporter substrate-binding protein [Dehalococcoidia bacterium]
MDESTFWTKNAGRLSRRSLLRGAAVGAAGLAGAALIGCGDDDDAAGGGAAPAATQAAGAATSAAATVADVQRGGELVYGWSYDPPNLDPHTGTSGGERQWLHMPYDKLVNTTGMGLKTPSGLLEPRLSLAESWEQLDDKTVVLNLRPNVKIWKTDEAVNADLVKWNLDKGMDPGATTRSALGSLDNVEVVDDLTVRLNQSQVSAVLLSNMTDRPGSIISRKHFEDVGALEFGRNPLGSGPYQIVDWQSEASITFEANKDHWMKDEEGRQMPYLDKFTMNIIPDTTVRVAALEAGESDLLTSPSVDYARLKEDSNLQLSEFVGSHTYQWYLNMFFPPLDNEKFRKALSLSLDRENYIKNLLKGHEPVGKGLLTPASWAWDDSIVGDEFNPAEARKLLEGSGLPESEWVLRGQPIGASLSTGDQFYEASHAQAGIKIDWAEPERGSYATRVLVGLGGDASAAAFQSTWSMRLDPDGNVGDFYQETASYNPGQHPVPFLEPLVVKARETLDIDERKAIYREIEQYSIDHVINRVTNTYAIAARFGSSRVGNIDKVFGGEGKERFYYLYNKEGAA